MTITPTSPPPLPGTPPESPILTPRARTCSHQIPPLEIPSYISASSTTPRMYTPRTTTPSPGTLASIDSSAAKIFIRMAYLYTDSTSRENLTELNQCLKFISAIPNLEGPIVKLAKKIEDLLSQEEFVQKDIDSLRNLLSETIRQTAVTPASTSSSFRRLSFCDNIIPEYPGETIQPPSAIPSAVTPLGSLHTHSPR